MVHETAMEKREIIDDAIEYSVHPSRFYADKKEKERTADLKTGKEENRQIEIAEEGVFKLTITKWDKIGCYVFVLQDKNGNVIVREEISDCPS